MNHPWQLFRGRWEEGLSNPLLASDAVDVVITDPPYDPRTHANGRRGGGEDGALCTATDKGFEALSDEELALFVREALRISRRWVVAFCSFEMLGRYRDLAGDAYVRGGAWLKTNPAPQFTGDRPGQWGEALAILHRPGRKRWNGGGRPARWLHPVESYRIEDRLHPTQKPLGLLLELVRDFTEPGEVVWDPYAGSGTTGVAALTLGRRFLGHEENFEHWMVAGERLAAAEVGNSLRSERAGQTTLDLNPNGEGEKP